MDISFKLFSLLILAILLIAVQSQAKPLEDSALSSTNDDEIMETAEGQNPFLPRFAMRKLKERRLKAQAQRRNNPVQRVQPPSSKNCNQNPYRRY